MSQEITPAVRLVKRTIHVKASNEIAKEQREITARKVIDAYGDQLPDARLCCFFDDQDWHGFKNGNTRGLYAPLSDDFLTIAPPYVKDLLITTQSSGRRVTTSDHLIYVHGSTCENHIGQTLTFAHELQHFRQYQNSPALWAASSLLTFLPERTRQALGWNDWSDFPHEHDARIIGKRIALKIIDPIELHDFIASRLPQSLSGMEVRDWQFVQGITANDTYDWEAGVCAAFQRLAPYRQELEQLLQERSDLPIYSTVNLDELLP